MSDRLKRCSACGEWKPATTEHFYPTTSRGRKENQWGEPYLRSMCRLCKLKDNQRREKERNRRQSPEERERYQKMQRARRRAYQRLAKMNEEGFKLFYAEELVKEGLKLDHCVGPTLREDTDRARLEGRAS